MPRRKSYIGKDGRILKLDRAFFRRLKEEGVFMPFEGADISDEDDSIETVSDKQSLVDTGDGQSAQAAIAAKGAGAD